MATENPTRTLAPEIAVDPAIVRTIPAIVSGAAVAGGIALRWSGLGRKSLWLDEGYTAWVVSNPWRQIVRIISVDTAPPLYYLLLRGWTQLFGFSEAALRSLSALMATVALFVFVAIARKIFKSPWAATASICLFSFSFMQIAYAHEARFYSMMTMMGAIDLFLVMLVCERSSTWRLIALSAAWSASLWTNNLMAVYLACLGIAWLILPGKRKFLGRLLDAIIVTVVAAVTFLPWLPTMLTQTQRLRGRFWAVTPDGWSLARTLSVMQGVHETALPRGDQHLFFLISLLLVGSVALACVPVATRRSSLALFSFGVLPILLIFLYSHVAQSIFMERAFLASGIAIPLLVVLPIESKRISRVFAVLCTLLLLGLSLKSIPGHRLGEHDEDWRGASAYAISSGAKHRLIVCVSSDGEPLFRYYARNRNYGFQTDVTAAPASFFAQDPPKTMQPVKSNADLYELRAKLKQGGYDEVVLLASHTWWEDQQELTLSLLKNQLTEIDQRQFEHIVVFRFAGAR